jgi:hypothetical protein
MNDGWFDRDEDIWFFPRQGVKWEVLSTGNNRNDVFKGRKLVIE